MLFSVLPLSSQDVATVKINEFRRVKNYFEDILSVVLLKIKKISS